MGSNGSLSFCKTKALKLLDRGCAPAASNQLAWETDRPILSQPLTFKRGSGFFIVNWEPLNDGLHKSIGDFFGGVGYASRSGVEPRFDFDQ